VLLNIGSEVIVERSSREAVDFLKDRITEMEASGKRAAETLGRLRTQMNEIAKRLELGYQQAVAAERAAAQAASQPARSDQDD
jgi:prefoldin alpha subunit